MTFPVLDVLYGVDSRLKGPPGLKIGDFFDFLIFAENVNMACLLSDIWFW